MPEFYHVSRTDLQTITSFDLTIFHGHITTEGLINSEDFLSYKTNVFEDGISKHGEHYLHSTFISDGPKKSFTPNELTLETIFDLVRQLKFPTRKSRFQCAFGCLSLDDARFIKKQTFNNLGTIYKVACDNFTISDMNLVLQAGTVIGLQVLAEKYWRGDSSPDPFWEVLMECPVKILGKIE